MGPPERFRAHGAANAGGRMDRLMDARVNARVTPRLDTRVNARLDLTKLSAWTLSGQSIEYQKYGQFGSRRAGGRSGLILFMSQAITGYATSGSVSLSVVRLGFRPGNHRSWSPTTPRQTGFGGPDPSG